MSYDLYFWRQTRDLKLSPEKIVDLLFKEAPAEGFATFPRISVRERFKREFPDIEDGDTSLDWEGAGSYFQVEFGHATETDVQMMVVTCGYELLKSEAVLNRVIEVCNSLGCALFDPQTGKRYAQPEPKNSN